MQVASPGSAPSSSPARSGRRAAIDAFGVPFIRLIGALFLLFFIAHTRADPDIWGHTRFGLDMLDTHGLSAHDPYSFTADKSWVNHEWLSELFMGIAYRAAGATGLVVLKVFLEIALFALVATALRRVRWRPADFDLLLALTLITTFPRASLVRPQLFSLVCFGVLLLLLLRADAGRRRAMWGLPVVMLVWANCHGAWIVGAASLLVWAGWRIAVRPKPEVPRVLAALAATAGVLVTLVNPYGVELWTYLHQTVGLSRPDIADWQPLFRLPLVFVVLWGISAVVALVALWRGRRTLEPWHVVVVAFLGAMSVKVGRLDAFFAVAVITLLGPSARRAPGEGLPPSWRSLFAGAPAVAATIAAFAIGGVAVASAGSCMRHVDTPEAASTTYLAQHFPRAHALTFFDWGQYAIWQLGPAFKVSMDGRRDTVYSDRLLHEHLRFYTDRPGSLALVRRLRPDVIWLPAHLKVVRHLRRLGWRQVFAGPQSAILTRDPHAPVAPAPPPHEPVRCFPDR